MPTESAEITGVTNQQLQLMRRAVRLRWPITKERRDEIIKVAESIMCNGNASERDRLAAAKLMLESDKINVAVTNLDSAPTTPQVNVGLAVNNNMGPTARDVAIELLKTAEGRAILTDE